MFSDVISYRIKSPYRSTAILGDCELNSWSPPVRMRGQPDNQLQSIVQTTAVACIEMWLGELVHQQAGSQDESAGFKARTLVWA